MLKFKREDIVISSKGNVFKIEHSFTLAKKKYYRVRNINSDCIYNMLAKIAHKRFKKTKAVMVLFAK